MFKILSQFLSPLNIFYSPSFFVFIFSYLPSVADFFCEIFPFLLFILYFHCINTNWGPYWFTSSSWLSIASALLPLVFPLSLSCQFNLKLIHSHSPGFVCCKVPLSVYASFSYSTVIFSRTGAVSNSFSISSASNKVSGTQ